MHVNLRAPSPHARRSFACPQMLQELTRPPQDGLSEEERKKRNLQQRRREADTVGPTTEFSAMPRFGPGASVSGLRHDQEALWYPKPGPRNRAKPPAADEAPSRTSSRKLTAKVKIWARDEQTLEEGNHHTWF